ncbi:MAG: GHKL domain-containing protein [Anaerolineales bacterium]|nr:GHKL domain-containing protein [Anaerolineales bacterium]
MFTKIRKWVAPPEYPQDHEKSRSATLLNSILWIFISMTLLYGFFAPIAPEMLLRRFGIITPFLLLLLILKRVLNLGYLKFTGVLAVVSLWTVFTIAMLYGADFNNPAYMGYLLVVVTAGLVLNWRASIGWGIISVVTNALLIFLGQKGYLPTSRQTTPLFALWMAQTVYIIVTVVLLSQAIRKIDEAFEKSQREINQRKRVEVEREKIIKELASKNAELERFTYTVSHDLKSPLITISGYAGLLENDAQLANPEKFKTDIARITEAAKKMQELLNNLLELSRIGNVVNPSEELSFNQLVEEALALVDAELRNDRVIIQVQEALPQVRVDRIRLVEVLQNLIDNAIKFSSVRPTPIIEIGCEIQNDITVFFVRDNGIGIDPKHHERVFGLFNKLTIDNVGTGIGLALVKRIIELHGGKIWIKSEVDRGATFYFTLPM